MNLYRIENMIGIDWVHSQYVPIKLVVERPLKIGKWGSSAYLSDQQSYRTICFLFFFNGNKLGKIDIYDMKIDITP